MSKFRPLRPKARRYLQYDYEFRSRSYVDYQAEHDDLERRINVIEIRPEVYGDLDDFFTTFLTYSQSIAPALFSDLPDTFTASAVTFTQTITPAVYTEAADTFGSTTVSQGALMIAPALFDNSTDTFTASTLTMGAISITPAVYTEAADTFPASTVSVAGGNPELIVNGDFAAGGTGWTTGSGWSIGSGVATASGANASLVQSMGTALTGIVGSTIRVEFDLTVTSGYIHFYLTAVHLSGTFSTTGHKSTDVVVPGGVNGNFEILGQASFVGTIDNISIKVVP